MSRSAARRAWTCGILCVLAGLALRTSASLLVFRGGKAALQKASELDPLSAEPLIELARLDPARGAEYRTAALRRNPWLTTVRLDLAQDLSTARQDREEGILLEAARRDRQCLPAWTLAHFYWTRGQRDEFWRWSAQCARVTKGDRRGVLRLARMAAARWQVPVEEVPERLNTGDRTLERELLNELLLAGDLRGSGRVADRILPRAGPMDAPLLVEYLERLLKAGHAGAAVCLWNQLCRRGLLHSEELGGRKANVKAGFQAAAAPSGFDWRFPSVPGATLRAGGPLRVRLDGQQAAVAELAWQYVALRRGRYRVSVDFSLETEDRPEAVELRAELLVARTGHSLILPASRERTLGQLIVRIDSREALGRLALVIRSRPGMRGLTGELAVFRAEIEALDTE
ncbi:MAG: hypothetical protein K2X35_22745 [Bryobacteraceae bacterium]|nr:hypothetical protein [Bryobacteraceae bacterium]